MSKRKTRQQVIMESITLTQLANMFANGRFATVNFVKKGDGSIRTLNGKTKIYGAMKGGEASYDASAKNQLRVCDVNIRENGVRKPGYRTVTVNNVIDVRANGKIYIVTREPGENSFIGKTAWEAGKMYILLSGKPYFYFKVPFQVFKDFQLSPNRGEFYNKFIRGVYDFERVTVK